MKILNEWQLATSNTGDQISVKIIPLKRRQNSMTGTIWVEVGKWIELESGKKVEFNPDGKSFYTGFNELYRVH